MDERPWPSLLKLSELDRGPVTRRIAAGPEIRDAIARQLAVDGLDRLEAKVEAASWLDGARLRGRLDAIVRQTCGVTLEPMETGIEASFDLKLLPAGSPNAPSEPVEAVLDPDAEDPPELIDDETIDLGAVVVEQLALEIDPFPRKPGAVFDTGLVEEPPSPFAALKDFKPKGG
jgi:uncharacterized metal-binding protein YceD (DUF177 family)